MLQAHDMLRAGKGLMAALLFWTAAACAAEQGGGLAEAARLAQRIADTALEAGLAREMAVHALENALAAQDKAEGAVFTSMDVGDRAAMRDAGKALKESQADSARAVAAAAEVVAEAVRAGSAATAADETLRGLGETPGADALEAALRRLRGLLRSAERAADKASERAGRMKERWLVAPVESPPATTSLPAPDMPETPTPVGRR
jgi:hypothetical protein